jgi:hypothetical protein
MEISHLLWPVFLKNTEVAQNFSDFFTQNIKHYASISTKICMGDKFWVIFSHETLLSISTQYVLGNVLGDFLTKPSGHPDARRLTNDAAAINRFFLRSRTHDSKIFRSWQLPRGQAGTETWTRSIFTPGNQIRLFSSGRKYKKSCRLFCWKLLIWRIVQWER